MIKLPKTDDYYKIFGDKENRKKEYKQLLKDLSNNINSKDYFKEFSSDSIHPERAKLHKKILTSILDMRSTSEEPSIHFLLGSIGSGKTSMKDQIIKNESVKKDYLFINFDDLKKHLPEYNDLKALNPTKAAQFVQSESATLAGKLFKKAIKKKCNIIFEKNIRKNKEGGFQLKHDMLRAIKNKYIIFIHIVCVDSFEEAWERVQKRAERIKRYVPKKEVKETFNNLFSNFNLLFKSICKESLIINLWYNGSEVDKATWFSYILTGIFSKQAGNSSKIKDSNKDLLPLHKNNVSILINEPRFLSLPLKVKKNLIQLDFF